MGVTEAKPSPRRARAPGRSNRSAWAMVAVVLAALLVGYARLRWPGALPLGSDNDEYLLVGQALASFDAPVVAGVEGTKYPLGFPLLLAMFDWLGLPPAPTALVVNLVALAAATGVLAWVAGRPNGAWPASPGAALVAGGVLVTSAAVWNDVYSVMPEILLLAVVVAILAVLDSPLTNRRVLILGVLGAVAVALKTLALPLVVGGAVVLWLAATANPALLTPPGGGLLDGAVRRRSPAITLIPAGSAVAMAAIGHVVMLPYPEHTTGYLATFPLVDPDDASQGRLGPVGLVSRAISDAPEALRDLGRAIAWIDAGTAAAATVAVVGLLVGIVGALRLRRSGPLGPFAAGAVLAYAAAMAAWPYNSSRFGLPLVPVAALGAAWVIREVGAITARPTTSTPPLDGSGDGARPGNRRAEVAIALGFLAVLVWSSWPAVADRAASAGETLPRQHEALDDLAMWANTELADAEVVSFDYREVSRRLDRDIQPIGYTSDPEALLAQVGNADYLVVLDFYAKRNAQARALLDAYPDRFTEVMSDEAVTVYRVD